MQCKYCSNVLSGNFRFCVFCGKPITQPESEFVSSAEMVVAGKDSCLRLSGRYFFYTLLTLFEIIVLFLAGIGAYYLTLIV